MSQSTPEGFKVPVHKSLVEPILVAGLPRTAAFIYWTMVAALIIGMHQLWILPLSLVGHYALTRLTKYDYHWLEVIRSSIKHTKDKYP